MAREYFCLGPSPGKVTLRCFVTKTSLQSGGGSCVFESSYSPGLITKQKRQSERSNLLPFVLKQGGHGVTEKLTIDTVLSVQALLLC